jgi:glycosyltransferase involved in cell wall biosynthesis
MTDQPNLTVVLPAFNAEKTLSYALDSILQQTYSNWKCLILNDGSTDSTASIAKEYCRQDARFEYIENILNIGLANTLNKAIYCACSKYLVRADSDDFSYPNRFQDQIDYLDSNSYVDILGTAAVVEYENKSQVSRPPSIIYDNSDLIYRPIVFHSSVMIRASFFRRVGLYDSSYIRSEDRELWIRAIRMNAVIHNLSQPLIKYHSDGYVRSWNVIISSSISTFRIAALYKFRHPILLALTRLLKMTSVKIGVYTPRSSRN